MEIKLRNYAYIGDAVWELYVREHTIIKTQNSKDLHKMTTDRVKASFQAGLLQTIEAELNEDDTIIFAPFVVACHIGMVMAKLGRK